MKLNKEEFKGKKFAVAFSGGKDSVFAMFKAIELGMEPVVLLMMTDEKNDRSWAHGIPPAVQEQIEEAYGVPLMVVKSTNDNYKEALENAIAKAKEAGAEYCVFGDLFDIPIEENWNTKRCEAVSVKPLFPLMGCDRSRLIVDFVEAGFKTIINTVNTNILSEDFLGKIIDMDLIEELAKTEADICGENGEYHSIVVDGPIFKKPILINWGGFIKFSNVIGQYSYKIML